MTSPADRSQSSAATEAAVSESHADSSSQTRRASQSPHPSNAGRWIDRFLIGCLIVVVAILTATAAPAVVGRPFGGTLLLAHMMASGALVFGLPVFAFAMIRHFVPQHAISWAHAAGYLLTVTAGLLTIASVFACMLPIPSTGQMHGLMQVHQFAGLAMTPAIALLLIGLWFTRSTSHRHS